MDNFDDGCNQGQHDGLHESELLELVFDEKQGSLLVESVLLLQDKGGVDGKWHVDHRTQHVAEDDESQRPVNLRLWVQNTCLAVEVLCNIPQVLVRKQPNEHGVEGLTEKALNGSKPAMKNKK